MSAIKTLSGVYVIQNTNSIERISNDSKLEFNKIWIYPAKAIAKLGDGSGVTPGLLIPNGAKINIGERTEGSADCTPDGLLATDLPIEIELPQVAGKSKFLRDVLIQGNAGDGIYFKFWQA